MCLLENGVKIAVINTFGNMHCTYSNNKLFARSWPYSHYSPFPLITRRLSAGGASRDRRQQITSKQLTFLEMMSSRVYFCLKSFWSDSYSYICVCVCMYTGVLAITEGITNVLLQSDGSVWRVTLPSWPSNLFFNVGLLNCRLSC